MDGPASGRTWQSFWHATVDAETRASVVQSLYHEGPRLRPFLMQFFVLLSLSTLIALYGLLENSTAVVIGAMVIAPLMSPLLSVAGAMVCGWPVRLLWSLALLLAGSAWSVLLAWSVSSAIPDGPTLPDQVLSRTSPGILDLGIALAAGAAGAYVQVRHEASSALPGVAIAVAVVPPLATVGICLDTGQVDLAGGALLLFMTNLVAIQLAAILVFLVTGFADLPREARTRRRYRWGMILSAALVVAVAYPLLLHTREVVTDERLEAATQDRAQEWLGDSDLTLMDVEALDDEITVELVGGDQPPAAGELAQKVAADVDQPVRITVYWTPRSGTTARGEP